MPKEEWGVKRVCPSCATRFYDLRNDPMTCPSCANTFSVESLTSGKSRTMVADKADAKSTAVKADDLDDDAVVLDDDDDTDVDLDDDILEDDEDDDVSLDEIADVASNDDQSWITKSPDGSVQVLLWDYSPVVPPKGQTDQVFYKAELPATPKGNIHLDLSHLRDGRYRLQTYTIGYERNDAYTAYLHMGAPSQLTRDQVAKLNAVATGAPASTTEITVKHGTFVQDLPLRTNDVYLLVLTPASASK